jgi:hypothetical protein
MAAKVARGPRATPSVTKVGGRMGGVWRLERKSKGIAVSIEPFGTFPDWGRRAVSEESERLARFFRLPLEGVR